MEALDTLIISRTDAIGDVVLTLPMAGVLKEYYPHLRILFLGRSYTRPVVECCIHIDGFLDRDDIVKDPTLITKSGATAIIHVSPDQVIATLAYNLKVPIRVGTSHRSFHWLRCNRLVNLGRKNSDQHEAQLNLRLLEAVEITRSFTLQEIPKYYGLPDMPPARKDGEPFRLIMHPKSSGSAREWPMTHYLAVARALSAGKYKIFVSGVTAEKEAMRAECPELFELPHVEDISGTQSLPEFIDFIGTCHGILACSTGPLHIASALGKYALGLFPPLRPMHPGRWAPLGTHAAHLVIERACKLCKREGACICLQDIQPAAAIQIIEAWEGNVWK